VAEVEPYVSLATLPPLADAIAGWFPELEGRSVAVADSEINKENVPTLPLCMVALIKAPPSPNGSPKKPAIVENIAVEFWFEPVKDRREDGSELPFYSFYDYDKVIRKLLPRIVRWDSPRGNRLKYSSMDVQATPFATIIQFVFLHDMFVCELDEEPEEQPPIDCNAMPRICVTFTDT
jgi:hypothetical protein